MQITVECKVCEVKVTTRIDDIKKALDSLKQFRKHSISPYHERYAFPFLLGTYFVYRKIDVIRLFSIAKAISDNPRYLDVGCGYGDFLNKIREFIPDAIGIEKNAEIFYSFGISKPDSIKIVDAAWGIEEKYDIIFVGWMEPGVDFREAIAAKTDVIVTTLDQGLSLAAEFDGLGFERIARWITPSWEDVNTEIMNKYYTRISNETREALYRLRSAHNLWYVYSRHPDKSKAIRLALLHREKEEKNSKDRYDFEIVLDEFGFGYLESLKYCGINKHHYLWKIIYLNLN